MGVYPVDAANTPAVDESAWLPLIDVSEMSMAELLATRDSMLARCVRRLVDSLDDPNGIISAFQSFAS
jgi:FXSXX-COOH protein